MNVIVTGGKGYIGSKIVKKLNCDCFDLQDNKDFREISQCKIFSKYDLLLEKPFRPNVIYSLQAP